MDHRELLEVKEYKEELVVKVVKELLDHRELLAVKV